MATYTELDDLSNDLPLQARIRTALRGAAAAKIDTWIGDNLLTTADERRWARNILRDAKFEGMRTLSVLLWDNRAFTVAQIQGATDATIKTRVDALVPWLVQSQADSV